MFRHILVPTDGTNLSVEAAKQAVQLAKSLGARITGFYAVPSYDWTYYSDGVILPVPSAKDRAELADEQARKYLSTIEVEAQREQVPCEVFHVISDSPYDAIIEAATKKQCDLICMASHGRRGLSGVLLGSETQKVLTHSTIPVLVCR